MLSVHLLGERRLLHAGSDVSAAIQYRKGWALLGYLAVESGRRHPREHLAELLWPQLPALAARTNLRQVVANLNRTFEAHGADGALLASRDDIALQPGDTVALDVHQLERAADAADDALVAEAPHLPLGGGFLDGLSFDDCPGFEAWLQPARARLASTMQRTLRRLHDVHLAAGRRREAIASARRLVAMDPWDESAVRLLMAALAADGRADEAIEAFDALRQALRADLGTDPLPATQALRDRLGAAREAVAEPPALRPAAGLPATGGTRHWLCGVLCRPANVAEGERLADALRAAGATVLSVSADVVHAGVLAEGSPGDAGAAARRAARLARGIAGTWPGVALALCPGLVQSVPGGGFALVGNPGAWGGHLLPALQPGAVLACESLFDDLYEAFALHPQAEVPIAPGARPLRLWRLGREGGTAAASADEDPGATATAGDGGIGGPAYEEPSAGQMTLRLDDVEGRASGDPVDAWLTVVDGPDLGKRTGVAAHPLVVGRAPDSDLQLPRRTVSRHHCVVWRDAGRYRLRDLGATNRTCVNGAAVLEARLREGDLVSVGEYTLRFGREL